MEILEDFLVFFNNLEQYRNRTISGMVYIYKNNSVTVKEFDEIIHEANNIVKLFYNSFLFASGNPVVEKTKSDIYISLLESENITFLKISELDLKNDD